MLKQFASLILLQASDGFFFNLSYALSCKSEFVADLFQCHLLHTNTKEHLNDFFFPILKGWECTVDFAWQWFVYLRAVSHRWIVVDQYIQKAVVFAIYERSINWDVSTLNFQWIDNLVYRQVELFCEFFCRRTTLIFLFEFRERFTDFVLFRSYTTP